MSRTNFSMAYRVIVTTCSVIALSSCVNSPPKIGVQFGESAIAFAAPPDFLKERSVWHDPSVIQYKLQSLAGYIIEKNQGENKFRRVKQVIPEGYIMEVEPTVEGQVYHSLIDSKFAITGSGGIPLLNFAGTLKDNQMLEVTILDKALIHVNDSIIPWNKLQNHIDTKPLAGGTERYWIQAVLITDVLSKSATKIESDGKITGSGFQVNGSVYNLSETQSRAPNLTLLLLDFDKALAKKKDDKSKIDYKSTVAQGRVTMLLNSPLE